MESCILSCVYKAIVANRPSLYVVGHYSRPDLLWFGVDKKHKHFVVFRNDKQEDA
jgi:hypothetical protein